MVTERLLMVPLKHVRAYISRLMEQEMPSGFLEATSYEQSLWKNVLVETWRLIEQGTPSGFLEGILFEACHSVILA